MPASTPTREFDRSESTVDEMVRRGVLPRPLRLSNGAFAVSWASVEAALASLAQTGEHKAPGDPFIAGARRAAQIARGQRKAHAKYQKAKVAMTPRAHSDEAYVIDLCDHLLGMKALRQWRFPFLLGDPGRNGRCIRLPVDAFYPEISLVVEYHERQHGESVPFFDRRITAAGISRGEQRRLYDERRRAVLPEHGMRLAVICYSELAHTGARRLLREREYDGLAIVAALEAAGIIVLSENGQAPGVSLRKVGGRT